MKEQAKRIEDKIIHWRRELHKIPEVGLELPKTSQYIQRQLEKMGVGYRTLLNGNAIVAILTGKKKGEGKVFAIRADIDALPIKEETGLDFASTNENMHACGHDGHAAILLGAVELLKDKDEDISGTILFLFQPGEEYPGGAKPMIDAGALSPMPDAIIGLHAGNLCGEVTGDSIGIGKGAIMASMDRFFIKIVGKGAHGASPHQSIDPISIAAEVISALQRIVSRELAPTNTAVVSVTRIQGGFNQNIIPGEVELEGTVRALDEETRRFIALRIEEITTHICAAHRAEAIVEYDDRYPPVIVDEQITELFAASAKKIVGEDRIVHIQKPLMGGEDMAFFLREVPGTFFFLSTPGVIDGEVYPHHHPKFDLKENQLWIGSALFAQMALDFLQ